eukprot:gene18102-biopygen33181
MPRSEPARKRLGWLSSEERRSIASEVMAAKVWNTGEPKCLRELLPEEDRRRTGTTRADKRGEMECCPAGRIGKKAFSNWAPEAWNRVCGRAITRKPQQVETKDAEKGVGKAPEDCHSKERTGYYAYLVDKYKTWEEVGRKVIWTDGSAVKDDSGVRRAGAGVFYGVGNEKNRALAVTGLQSNQRAELTAALHVLEE